MKSKDARAFEPAANLDRMTRLQIVGFLAVLTGILYFVYSPIKSTESHEASLESSRHYQEKKDYYRTIDSNFVSIQELLEKGQIQGGDLIEYKRFYGVYDHWAVYIGNKMVIHSTPPSKRASDKASVRKESINKIEWRDGCRINNLEVEGENRNLTPRRRTEIILAAEDLMEKWNSEGIPYNLITNNCQHFATEARFGVPFCTMLELISDKDKLTKIVNSFA